MNLLTNSKVSDSFSISSRYNSDPSKSAMKVSNGITIAFLGMLTWFPPKLYVSLICNNLLLNCDTGKQELQDDITRWAEQVSSVGSDNNSNRSNLYYWQYNESCPNSRVIVELMFQQLSA